ncbi:MAG: ABC transporter permease [Deltaproteobacteria bacterium]|nr:ABC transporter permease [Deltaproteobacteria bacterium]
MAQGLTKLAWRNLGRNRRRTLITASALAIGTALTIAVIGLIDGMHAQLIHTLTRLDLGHLQAHQRDYRRTRQLERTLPHPVEVRRALERDPRVVAVSPRVHGAALASSGRRSLGVSLFGVEPRSEIKITEFHQTIRKGRYLDDDPTPWPRGRALTAAEAVDDERLTQQAEDAAIAEIEGDSQSKTAATPARQTRRQQTQRLARAIAPPPKRPPRVLIGKTLARYLAVGIGEQLFVSTQAVDGTMTELAVEVIGIFESGTTAFDRTRVILHVGDLRRMLHLDGRIHELAAVLVDLDRADDVALSLAGTVGPDVAIASWGMIQPTIRHVQQQNAAGSLIIMLVIFAVAALGVVNTMLMAVFERKREIGVLKALGMTAGRIVRMFVAEATLLAFFSALAGALLGLLLDLYLHQHGINLSANGKTTTVMGIGMGLTLRAKVTAFGVLMPIFVLCAVTLLASLYPAWRAARLKPAQGMREV